jgi:LPXTG-motif cell wall-anchored protein
MRSKVLIGVTALTATAVLQWLPTTVQAADAVPTACVAAPAPQGPTGDKGPQGDVGPQGDAGPDATPPPTTNGNGGPARVVHPAVEQLPLCADIEGICIVNIPGPKGPTGDKGPDGDKGPTGEPGVWNDNLLQGPSRAPHSLTGADPCAGVNDACEITLTGTPGAQGAPGDKGETGPQGEPGMDGEFAGPSRSIHPQVPAPANVVVQIPQDCRTYLESLAPATGGLPATGTASGTLVATATALLALGASALLVRRRTAAA